MGAGNVWIAFAALWTDPKWHSLYCNWEFMFKHPFRGMRYMNQRKINKANSTTAITHTHHFTPAGFAAPPP